MVKYRHGGERIVRTKDTRMKNKIEKEELTRLLLSVKEGNSAAVGEIFNKFGKVIAATVSFYYKKHEDIEDCVHDVLIAIAVKARTYRANKNPFLWLNNKVKELAQNRLFKSERLHIVGLEYAENIKVEIDEDKILVAQLMKCLTERERDIIVFRYWYEMSYLDIGKIFHRSKSMMKYTVEAIEAKMRAYYEQDLKNISTSGRDK